MAIDAQQVIRTLIQSELVRSYRRDEPGYRPVITLSRDLGAGGEEIAERLAARLGVPKYDRQILDAISESAKVNRELMERLDEKVRSGKDAWIYSLLGGQDAFVASYRHHLVNVVLGIAQEGGVILGRGAHIILANREVLRLRVVGSELKCARRLADREAITVDEAVERVRKVDAERDQFLHGLFKRRLSEASLFDLVVNTDKLTDWESGVDLIFEALSKMGFAVKDRGRKDV